jgi:hypothetical protein
MAHVDRNSVTLKGKQVPLKLTDLSAFATGTVEIDDYTELLTDGDDTITVGTTVFTAQSGPATLGEATFRAATGNNETATSLAAQINAHEDTAAIVEAIAVGAVVTITALVAGLAGNAIALAYTDEGTDGAAILSDDTLLGGYNAFDYVVEGAAVFVNDTTGFATEEDDGTTETNWKYASGPILGAAPTVAGTISDCALVNM